MLLSFVVAIWSQITNSKILSCWSSWYFYYFTYWLFSLSSPSLGRGMQYTATTTAGIWAKERKAASTWRGDRKCHCIVCVSTWLPNDCASLKQINIATWLIAACRSVLSVNREVFGLHCVLICAWQLCLWIKVECASSFWFYLINFVIVFTE